MSIVLIDYGMGNLLSVAKAFEFLGEKPEISSSPESVADASSVVLPGVGNFGDGMRNLETYGLVKPVLNAVRSGKPFLGICLGMQMLLESSEEAPDIPGLGVFRGKVVKFPGSVLKVPHMGWNSMNVIRRVPCLKGVAGNTFFYFVHSYYAAPEDSGIVAGTSDYGEDFAAALGKDNVFATQFHPEKSQDPGLKILENFLGLAG